MFTKKSLTLADAKAIAAAAEAEALKNNWNVTISIVDDGGNLIYLQRLDDAGIGSVAVSQEKARTAFLFKRSTKSIEEVVAGGRAVMLTLPGATPIQGGLPLLNEGRVVGAIGISGVQSSEDEQIARAGVEVAAKL
ncbi:GlcG/HbpS family heme-binding protein [Methylocella tundrae]|uniref:Protein GlcG n=1 Tax=Methylocella tundrae TaxID=227605 RepID=A0A4U8Z2V5_METTU|nr:heme-binding protein [Methylocella tundrae]WPP03560.1 heme-binding protein [Methylocella tundrae]VFU09668.1 Protein GlcG [Methylocella tundrae]